MSSTYPIGLVGELNYQPAIRRCSPGQRVQIVHEPDNPYDSDALAVVSEQGQTLGYIARDSWLMCAVHDEGRGCDAVIKEINESGAGLGVVIQATLNSEGVQSRAFSRPAATTDKEPKGWLARILGF